MSSHRSRPASQGSFRHAGHGPSRYAGHGTVHGVVVVDKPEGPTSHDVVAAARRHFGTRRIGHAGTLDPLATGVLVLLLGEATKLSAFLTRDAKSYRTEVVFGAATTTLDAQGTVTRRRELPAGWLTRAALEGALHQELDRRLQVPPAVSAIRVDGKRAHARARQGEDLEMAPRDVRLHEVQVVEWNDRRLVIELTVSKGYYVRSFARDLGEALGVPAHVGALRRTRSGPFTLAEARPFPPPEGVLPLPLVEVARQAFPVATLTERGVARARMGQPLSAPDDFERVTDERPPSARPEGPDAPEGLPVACLEASIDGSRLVALAGLAGPGTLRILRGIHDPAPSRLHAPGSVG